MSEPLTPVQLGLVRQASAATVVVEAKLKEHEAACLFGLVGNIIQAREAVQSAIEALLDAKERIYRTMEAQ